MLSVGVLLFPESEEHSVDEEADLRAMSVIVHAILGCRSSLQGGLFQWLAIAVQPIYKCATLLQVGC